METLGSRIRDLRERRGLGAREFARRVGMAYSTLMDLENGHSKSTRRLHAIIEELGTTAEYLEHGRGGPGTDVLGASAPSQAPAASHPVRLDVETLASAIATIESAFDKAGATMSAIGRAKIIAAYYADLVRTPDMDPKAAADAALAAVIRAMSKGAKDDQHVPAR